MNWKALLLLAFTACRVTGAAGQQALGTDGSVPPTWMEIKPLLERVSTLRVEYRADLGLAILRQAHATIPKAVLSGFLDDLFTSAHSARYQTSFTYAGRNREASSKASEANSLRQEAVDALSIQSSVVVQMLNDSPEEAAQRFTEIHITGQRATCTDPAVEDLSSYYEALQILFADPRMVTFNAEPRGQFLLDRFREALTPAQIVPLLTVFSRIDPGPEDGEAALQIAAANLDGMTASGRELDALDTKLNQAFQRLETYAGRRNLPLTNIALAYRSFLVRSAGTPTCEGDSHSRKYTSVNFGTFRSRLSQETQKAVPALTLADVETTTQGASAPDPPISNFAGLPEAARQRLTNSGALFGLREPSPITAEDTSAILASLAQGSVPEACELCSFQGHIRLFNALTWRQSAGGPLRALLLAEVRFLAQNPIEEKNPPAFLSGFKSLIEGSRASTSSSKPSSDGVASQRDRSKGYSLPELSTEADFLREQLLLSNDAIISTYMQFETVFHIRYTPTSFVGAAIA